MPFEETVAATLRFGGEPSRPVGFRSFRPGRRAATYPTDRRG
jgi:hypothetical protein